MTRKPQRGYIGPIHIIVAIHVSVVLSWFFILGLPFSIQDYETMVTSLMGQQVTQIILHTVSKKGVIALTVSDVS
jgi:hypothetical protein